MALGTAERMPVKYDSNNRHWFIYKHEIAEDDNLPEDPRTWTRKDVAHWVKLLTSQHNLPEVSPTRFLMNGKALCLMTPSMFLDRVPLGGKLLYKDFQLRLCSTLYSAQCN